MVWARLGSMAVRGGAALCAAAFLACAAPSGPGGVPVVVIAPHAKGLPRSAGRAPAAPAPADSTTRAVSVSASAYNSLRSQADRDPTITAFGEKLRPGMRTIAVSRDLEELGLDYGTIVRIDELPGEWRVADRMSSRWKRTIDLYFGNDVRAAREWGRRAVTIRWEPDSEAESSEGE